MTTETQTNTKISLDAVREHVRTSELFTRKVVLNKGPKEKGFLNVNAVVHIVPTDKDVFKRFVEAVNNDVPDDEAEAEAAFRSVCEYLAMMVVEWDIDIDPTVDALVAADDGFVIGVFASWVYEAVSAGPKGTSSSSRRSTRSAKTSRRK